MKIETVKNKRDFSNFKGISKSIFKIALPIMLCHILQVLFNVVDMVWIGKLGAEYTAALSWAGNVLMVLVTFIVGLSTGAVAIITRNIGAHEYEEAGRAAFHTLVLGFFIALFISVLGYYFIEDLIVSLGAEVYVAKMAADYLKIIFLFSSVMVFMFLASAVLYGSGNMRIPTKAVIYATIINLILDPLLIFGVGFFPRMEIKGAALATVLARTVGMFICMYALFNGKNKIKIIPQYMKINLKIMSRILKIGIPGALQTTMRSSVGLAMVVIVGTFGFKCVAAYGIGLKLLSMAMMSGFGLAAASSILVGQRLGAKEPKNALNIALISAGYNALIMAVFAVLFVSFPYAWVRLFTRDLEVIGICTEYLSITVVSYVFIGIGLVFGKSLNGAGDTSSTMFLTLICLWIIQVPLALFYTMFWGMGVAGVWWAIMIATFLQSLSTIMWFTQGKWQTKKI
jgi:putative MATE family efflux protein